MTGVIGVLGAGQLGRMLALSAYPLGLRTRLVDPAPDACAGQVAEHVVAGFEDYDALARFAEGLDVVTFEWENVPVAAARFLAARLPFYPSPAALETAQDRLLEKRLFTTEGIPTAAYEPVDSLDQLRAAVDRIGLPAVLKTRRLGYDGKGQYVLRTPDDIEPAWRAVGAHLTPGPSPTSERGDDEERGTGVVPGVEIPGIDKAERRGSAMGSDVDTQTLAKPPAAPWSSMHGIEQQILGVSSIPPAIPGVETPSIAARSERGVRDVAEHGVSAQLPGVETPGTAALILEAFVPFSRELSIIAVRARDGDTRFYPLTENHHRDGILRLSLTSPPGPLSEVGEGEQDESLSLSQRGTENLGPGQGAQELGSRPSQRTAENSGPPLRSRRGVGGEVLQLAAESIAQRVLRRLDYVGVLTIELFEHDGRLLANEMATRVHNSGHWTIDGAVTSQFENHIRAIAGLPLGDTSARGYSAMVNLIGTTPDPRDVLAIPGAHLHLYGKSPRPGRKLGHVTVVGESAEAVRERAEAVEQMANSK